MDEVNAELAKLLDIVQEYAIKNKITYILACGKPIPESTKFAAADCFHREIGGDIEALCRVLTQKESVGCALAMAIVDNATELFGAIYDSQTAAKQ